MILQCVLGLSNILGFECEEIGCEEAVKYEATKVYRTRARGQSFDSHKKSVFRKEESMEKSKEADDVTMFLGFCLLL